MSDLSFALVDKANFDDIPAPFQPGARCQTCDYWERLDGSRTAADSPAARDLKRSRLLAGARVAGTYAMLALRTDVGGMRHAVGYAQFGPISAYPRAQVIRDRYPSLPESPPPWVVTCLQVGGVTGESAAAAGELLAAVVAEIDRRGITAIEAYVEGVPDAWLPSPGPGSVYADAGFELAAGDDRYPVYRRELAGELGGWGDLLSRARPPGDADEGWPMPQPKGPSEDDLFRLPPRPKRPNPFGED